MSHAISARPAPTSATEWADALRRHRGAKDEFLRRHPASPLPPDERQGFAGLPYYPPALDRRVAASVQRLAEPEVVTLATSSGTPRRMRLAARLHFALDGAALILGAYVAAEGHPRPSLFVPFSDATSGRETYGAGRYLDVHDDGGDALVLDFNLAYHPYCVYAEGFTCPIAPAENRLAVAIRAGERLPARPASAPGLCAASSP
jgi:hypothetical protein